MPVMLNPDGEGQRTSQRHGDGWVQQPARTIGCSLTCGHGIEDAMMHADWWLGVAKTRQQVFDRPVRIFHRALPPSFVRGRSSSRSRSLTLALESSARTADSLRRSTAAISAVPSSSMAESSNTWRSALGNRSISRRTERKRSASSIAVSAGMVALARDSANDSSSWAGRLRRFRSKAMLQDTDEDVLHYVFGFRPAPQHRVGYAEEEGRIGVDEGG